MISTKRYSVCYHIIGIILFIELDDGEIYRKALYLMVKTMVSCRFSLKPIHWYISYSSYCWNMVWSMEYINGIWLSLYLSLYYHHWNHLVNFLCRWDDSLCRTGGWSDLFPRCRVDPTGPWGGRRTTTAWLRCDSTRKKWGKNRAKSQVLAEIGMEAMEIGEFYQQELWLPKTYSGLYRYVALPACRLKRRRWGFRKTFTQKGTRIWPAICDAWLPGCFFFICVMELVAQTWSDWSDCSLSWEERWLAAKILLCRRRETWKCHLSTLVKCWFRDTSNMEKVEA